MINEKTIEKTIEMFVNTIKEVYPKANIRGYLHGNNYIRFVRLESVETRSGYRVEPCVILHLKVYDDSMTMNVEADVYSNEENAFSLTNGIITFDESGNVTTVSIPSVDEWTWKTENKERMMSIIDFAVLVKLMESFSKIKTLGGE